MVVAAFFYGFFSLVSGFMKSSEPYQLALARVRASPAVVEALGTPIAEGFFVMGNLHVSGPAGQAQFEIPLRAPKGRATIYVAARKSAGVWRMELLVVQLEASRQRIDLLEKQPPPR